MSDNNGTGVNGNGSLPHEEEMRDKKPVSGMYTIPFNCRGCMKTGSLIMHPM